MNEDFTQWSSNTGSSHLVNASEAASATASLEFRLLQVVIRPCWTVYSTSSIVIYYYSIFIIRMLFKTHIDTCFHSTISTVYLCFVKF